MDTLFSKTIAAAPEDSKSYKTIYFELEADCDRLEISYSVNNSSVIDFGIEREDVSVGWSGSERSLVYIEQNTATPGYIPGLTPGRWGAVLGLHTCREETEISLTIRQIKQKQRWFKGDLHNHSHHSDGRHPLSNVFRFAREHQFDFISVTDHNTCSQNLFHNEDSGILVIPGMELTSYWGHMNYWGIDRPVKDHKIRSKDDLIDNIKEAKATGAVASINHPFKGPSIWEYGYDMDFDSLEVWNGPWSEKNGEAVKLWDSMLRTGKQIAAVGGSDSHGSKSAHAINYESSHQIPTNWINSESHSIKGLLANIAAGHVFVTYLPSCPRLSINDSEKNNLMGNQVPLESTISIQVQDMRETDILKLITEKGCIRRETGLLSFNESVKCEEALYLRLEVWRKTSVLLKENPNLIIRGREKVISHPEKYLLASLGNPVYFRETRE